MIDPITLASASLALDAASLRQRTIAANIANAQTPGYVPAQVSFEDRMSEAREDLREGKRLSASDLVVPVVVDSVRVQALSGSGSEIALDSEVANLARNNIHYQALVKALSGQFALVDAAMMPGSR